MLKLGFAFCLTFVVIHGHLINKAKIKSLNDLVKDYEVEQKKIYEKLNNLETAMTEKIENLASGATGGQDCPDGTVSTCVSANAGSVNLGNLEIRLTDLEQQMDEILKYLTSEKQTDEVLKTKSSEVIQEMESKVKETDTVILQLQESVDESLANFENKIKAVNQSAQVTIKSKGVIFYGGVGSPCSYDEECLTNRSECRSGRCQCNPGLSFNLDERTCVEDCDKYGDTYQSIENYIIRGYNNLTMKAIKSFEDCKVQCSMEINFSCVTIDYFPRWKTCYLSGFTKMNVPEEAFEYNSAGIHFQRDCA